MSLARSVKIWVAVGVATFLIALAVFLALGPPQLFARSESPEFCGETCHPMESNYEAWTHARGHREVECVQCHLPNDGLVGHLWQKGQDGLHDILAFTTGRVPQAIQLSERGAEFVQDNCERCHAGMVDRIDDDRRCWSCHRGLSHGFGGSVEPRTP